MTTSSPATQALQTLARQRGNIAPTATLADLRQTAEWYAIAVENHRNPWRPFYGSASINSAVAGAIQMAGHLAEAANWLGNDFVVPEDGDFLDWIEAREDAGEISPVWVDQLTEGGQTQFFDAVWRMAHHLRQDQIRYLATEARFNPMMWYREDQTVGQSMYLSQLLTSNLGDLSQEQRLALMRGEDITGQTEQGEQFTITRR